MNHPIDESHVCLMKNWTTYKKTKMSENEIQSYILEIAKNVVAEVARPKFDLFEIDIKRIESSHWFGICPKTLAYANQSGMGLFYFGIEGLEPDEILRSESTSWFRAFVYSENRNQDQNLAALFQSIAQPKGFEFNIGKPEIGYFYTRGLTPLNVEILADSKSFAEHLKEPLIDLFDWYQRHSKQIDAVGLK
jgi:hypothetical protein